MAFYHRIPDKYLWLLPSLYLAGLGAYDLLTDVWTGNIVWWRAAIDIFLCIPLVKRRNVAFIVFGAITTIVFGYLELALTSDLIRYINAPKHSSNALAYFGVGYPFITFSCLCGLALVFAGSIRLQKTQHR